MAAAVNNIAATFSSSARISSKPHSLSKPNSISLTVPTCSMPAASVSWNPQSKLPSSFRCSLVSLYGGPGPKLKGLGRGIKHLNPRSKAPRGAFQTIKATISVGDKLPEATLSFFDNEDNLQTITVSDLTKGKKVVMFAVPGAFTPTCSQKHLPGFVEKADELKSKGVDSIVCISVNDAFVMKAWKKDINVGDKVLLLADGNGEFTKAMGVSLDLSDKPAGLGIRSRRYALLADDGVVKVLKLEEGGAFTVSGADDILKEL